MTKQRLAYATQMSLNIVAKMEAGHPGGQLRFYLKALWAVELIDYFTKQLRNIGINETVFSLVGVKPTKNRSQKIKAMNAICGSCRRPRTGHC